ncbi:MAG: GNAT family N-acetyltransferase [Bacillota bacterium]|nr:GNAT family N-acetyltransferase [Bacillota bacterium]MDP4171283.1 GNAT family N-acetyltransferase [Bacillota bacterium]
MNNFKIREATELDVDFLWDMLYEAIYVKEGDQKPPRNILKHPNIASYLTNWGRKGDRGLIATDSENRPVGAVWIRLFDGNNKTYGYLNEHTPILSMALLEEFRGRGIGTQLLKAIINDSKFAGYSALSLSVDSDNPARHLYEKCGFNRLGLDGTSWDMVLTFNTGS